MIKFGTGGWRAIIGDEFTKENIRRLTAGLCRLMDLEGLQGSEICVGYDRRFLSKEAAHWAAEVLAGWGYPVFMVNRSSPTPLIMYTVKERNYPYGMAITASHNPAVYNGIKIFTAGGRDADQTVTAKIEEQIAQVTQIPEMDYDEAVASGIIREGNPFNSYIDQILSLVDTKKIRNTPIHVAIDPMYGVGLNSLRTVLLTCRCDVDMIHEEHDTLFGGKMPAPSQDSLKMLSNYVLDHHCDLGVATDGDADRLGVIDENGNYVPPNQLLVMLYYYLVKYRGWHGPCVRNNSTSHLLDRVAEGLGEVCYEVPVGFKYVSSKMTETDAVIGGESSGGLAVRGHISGKDGIYATALLVEMLAVTGKKVSQLYDEIIGLYGKLYAADASITMTNSRKKELQELLFTEKQVPDFGCEIKKISYMDGCKVYFVDGSWVICRFSGTEPLLRIGAEAQTQARANEYIACWRKLLSL